MLLSPWNLAGRGKPTINQGPPKVAAVRQEPGANCAEIHGSAAVATTGFAVPLRNPFQQIADHLMHAANGVLMLVAGGKRGVRLGRPRYTSADPCNCVDSSAS